jgi:chromosome segregation ATPase
MTKKTSPFHSIPAVLALAAAMLAAPEALAQDKPATAEAVQGAKSPAVPAAVVQKPEAAPADDPGAEAYRKRLMELRGPRDKGMADIQSVTEKIAARKKAIQAEDEKAGKLAAEIEALTQELSGKETALAKIYDEDEGLKALNQDLAAAHESFRQSQRNVRDEIARRHREHAQQIEKQQREAEAAKAKAEEAEAAKAAGGAKPEAAK